MMLDRTIIAILISAVAFVTVYAITPSLIKVLTKKNMVVKDYNKEVATMVARPGGPSILAGILASELTLYAFFPSTAILAIIITTSLAFLVGLADDRKVLGGWFKPLALAASALIIFIIPVMGNTINSIDVLNGVASGFMTIASFALTVCLVIVHNYDVALASLPLGFVSLAFYKYHKVPSKIFPGDSGALTLGAMYGTLSIVGHVEIIAAIALLP